MKTRAACSRRDVLCLTAGAAAGATVACGSGSGKKTSAAPIFDKGKERGKI